MANRKFRRWGDVVKSVGVDFTGDPGLTKQAHKDECDIDKIVNKYERTGVVTHLSRSRAEYGFATSLDLSEAIQILDKATEMFEELPSQLRAEFNNDPGKLLDFIQNPENEERAIEIGLIERVEPAPAPEPPSETPSEAV